MYENDFLKQYVPDMDLADDEPWLPVFNPYSGRVTPSWQITAEARMRIEVLELAER